MMHRSHGSSETDVVRIVLLIIAFFVTVYITKRVNRLSWGEAFGAAMLFTLVTGMVLGARNNSYSRMLNIMGTREATWHEWSRLVMVPVFATLGAFLLLVVQHWRGTNISEQEKMPGAAGLRAVLAPMRLVWVLLLTTAITLWFQVPPFAFPVLLMLLCMAPLIRLATAPEAEEAIIADTVAPEREKVLDMISAKKITPEEGAELLSALSTSNSAAARNQPTVISPAHQTILVGALLVVVGFFLPWFSYNPGHEVSRLMGQMTADFVNDGTSMVRQIMPPGMDVQIAGAPEVAVNTPTVRVSGGDIADGLGWIILLMAIAAAATGFFANRLDTRTRRLFQAAALAVGSFLLIYVLSSGMRHVAFGMMVVIAGYVCEILGAFRDSRRTLRPA